LPKQPPMTALEAEKLLFKAGFEMIRSKGSHRIYQKFARRVVVPFHSNRLLHPKIVKQVLEAIEKADEL